MEYSSQQYGTFFDVMTLVHPNINYLDRDFSSDFKAIRFVLTLWLPGTYTGLKSSLYDSVSFLLNMFR